MIQTILERRSCRKFKKEQISKQDLDLILQAGLSAPSGMNLQNTKIVVVQDEKDIKILSDLNRKIWGKDVDPFYGAPTICLVLAPKDSRNNIKDGALVIGYMQIAAYAINVGSCWINRCDKMMEDEIGQSYLKKWNCEDYIGIGVCILGYPDQKYSVKQIKEDRVVYNEA